MKVLSLKEEDLIFKENKLNIGHAFRKKNNFDQPGGQQQGGYRVQNGMGGGQNGMGGGGQGQHPMMGGNMGGLGLGNIHNKTLINGFLSYFLITLFKNRLISYRYLECFEKRF